MNTEPAQSFDYGDYDSATRQFLEERAASIFRLARTTASAIVEIGRYLTEVKERIGHGEFLKWIALKFQWSERHARNFMYVFDQFESANFAGMDIDVSALYALAAPKTPEPVRVEVIRRAEQGEKITHESVIALRKRFDETGELPKSTTALVAMALDAKRETQQLPSPAKAREIAAQTGKHTLDRTGVYQPPAPPAARDDYFEQYFPLVEFVKFCRHRARPIPEYADVLRRHPGVTRDDIRELIDWLTRLQEVL